MQVRRAALIVAASLVIAAVALPAIAASPSPAASDDPKASPPGQTKQDKAKPSHEPDIAETVTGTVRRGVDADGHPSFTLTAGSTVWELSAGPAWYWGDKNPLAVYVGKSVTIAGDHRAGSTELDVSTVDGKAIREPGKPPWAGGPWVVGPSHPGWKPWMADGKPGKGLGRAGAPGQTKDEPEPSGD